MIRIMHTALVSLFVAAALLGYGAKEETRALGKQIERLEANKVELHEEIALLRAEWDHVTSADFLIETARRLDGQGPLRGAEGRPLAPWRAAQVLPLAPTTPVPPRDAPKAPDEGAPDPAALLAGAKKQPAPRPEKKTAEAAKRAPEKKASPAVAAAPELAAPAAASAELGIALDQALDQAIGRQSAAKPEAVSIPLPVPSPKSAPKPVSGNAPRTVLKAPEPKPSGTAPAVNQDSDAKTEVKTAATKPAKPKDKAPAKRDAIELGEIGTASIPDLSAIGIGVGDPFNLGPVDAARAQENRR